MTIELNAKIDTLLDDLSVLDAIFKAESPELVEDMNKYMVLKNISTSAHIIGNIIINVTPLELALIGVFNKGKI